MGTRQQVADHRKTVGICLETARPDGIERRHGAPSLLQRPHRWASLLSLALLACTSPQLAEHTPPPQNIDGDTPWPEGVTIVPIDDDLPPDETSTPGDDDSPPAGSPTPLSGDDDTSLWPPSPTPHSGDDDTTSGIESPSPQAGDDDSPGVKSPTPQAGDDDSPEVGSPTPAAGDDDSPPTWIDQDQDGYPAWYQFPQDPALADCNDLDPNVSPDTERLIPEGPFLRGNDDLPEASPMREIWLSPYCMDVYPVTNIDFVEFMTARIPYGMAEVDEQGLPLYDFEDVDDEVPERILRDGQGGYTIMEGYDYHPVVEVYQWSSEAFCETYGKRTPTEAEWEKGARGDQDDRPFPWGYEEATCDLANYATPIFSEDGNYVIGGDWCVGDTTPVGAYPNASPFGLYDMTGNVSEIVADFYRADYYAESPEIDPLGPETGFAVDSMNPDGFVAYVARGGVWAMLARQVFERYPEMLTASSNGLGFRCARSLDYPDRAGN